MKKFLVVMFLGLLLVAPSFAGPFAAAKAGGSVASVEVAPNTSPLYVTSLVVHSDLNTAKANVYAYVNGNDQTTTSVTTATGQSYLTTTATLVASAGDYIFIADKKDTTSYEAAVVGGVSSYVVTLNKTLSNYYPAGARVWKLSNVGQFKAGMVVGCTEEAGNYQNSRCVTGADSGSPLFVITTGTAACQLSVGGYTGQ